MNMKVRRMCLLAAAVIIGLAGVWLTAPSTASAEPVSVRVEKIHELPDSTEDSGVAAVTLRILSGRDQGDTLYYTQHLWGHPDYDPTFRNGDVFTAEIVRTESGERDRLNLHQQRKDWKLGLLFLVVTLVLFVVGRWEGLMGLISTLLTLGMIFGLFFPWVDVPRMIMPMGIVICLATIILTVCFVMNWKEPALPAIGALVAVFGLITVATILGFDYLHLDAVRARHSRLIISWLEHSDSLWQLITFGIVIGTLGALMDVAVVISSTIHEIVRDAPEIPWTEAYRSGLRVGREIFSTMINTLVFAYMGILLPILLGFRIFDLSWLQFIHYDFVGIELLRITVGLLGLSVIIPVTSLFSALWFQRR